MSNSRITGLILAGGAGRRAGGQDKGWLSYHGDYLIEHQIRWLKPQVNEIIISANRNIKRYQSLGYPVISDKVSGFAGPLYGILGGLEQIKGKLWVQPVDMPDLPSNLLAQVTKYMKADIASAYIATSERRHYLSMLIDTSSVAALRLFLAQRKARVSEFHHLIGSQVLHLDLSESLFKNLNISKDYQHKDD